MLPKILVIGATGQVGRSLKDIVHSNLDLDVHYTGLNKAYFQFSSRTPKGDEIALDLNAPEADIMSILDGLKPSIIINAAAWTAVDLAEEKKEEAFKSNAEAPGTLARWAVKNHAHLIHFSTDYVFDGSLHTPRAEDAPTDPLQVYGRSKLLGEHHILSAMPDGIILRTSWVFSEHGTNFLKTMLRLGKDREELNVVRDQIGAPTAAFTLADVSLRFASMLLPSNDPNVQKSMGGIYHVASRGETNWYEFACEIFKEAQKLEFPLKIKTIKPILSSQYPTPAQRPMNSRLDLTKVEKTLGISLPDWRECMIQVLLDLRKNI